jgi:tetratricopeptide (TPR) repeat protein
MCAALMGYWSVRVISQDNEARIVAAIEVARSQVRDRPDADRAEQALAARLLGEAARIWAISGRGIEALGWAQEAVALAEASDDAAARQAAVVGLAVATVFAGRAGPGGVAARQIFDDAIELTEQRGEWWAMAMSAGFAGTSLSTFDPEAGEALLQRGVVAARRSGSPYAIGAVTMAQGRTLGHIGQTDDAIAAFGVAIRSFTELGDTRFVLASRSDLAHALRRGGRLDEAMAMYHETIGGWVHLGQKGAVANQLENIAYVEIERGDFDRATCLLGAAAAIREASGSQMAYDEEPELAGYLDRLRGATDADDFEAAWNAGRALPQADAVALALAEEAGPG